MERTRILPFYMTYPLPLYYQQEDSVSRDLEYLQQMYPEEARKYQKSIVEILDRMDYEGSMIYDEYPDKWQIFRLTQLVTDKILAQEAADAEGAEENANPVQKEHLEAFVQILLSYEIYRRRHSNRNGILRF